MIGFRHVFLCYAARNARANYYINGIVEDLRVTGWRVGYRHRAAAVPTYPQDARFPDRGRRCALQEAGATACACRKRIIGSWRGLCGQTRPPDGQDLSRQVSVRYKPHGAYYLMTGYFRALAFRMTWSSPATWWRRLAWPSFREQFLSPSLSRRATSTLCLLQERCDARRGRAAASKSLQSTHPPVSDLCTGSGWVSSEMNYAERHVL